MLVRRISTFREGEHGAWRRSFEEHRLRLWPPSEVYQRLRTCGFEGASLDGYDGLAMPPALNVFVATKLPAA